MTLRTRFRVARITRATAPTPDRKAEGEIWHVLLTPVHSSHPEHENAAVWAHRSTDRPDPEHPPGGGIHLTCTRPLPETFPLGCAVFVDFTPAEPSE